MGCQHGKRDAQKDKGDRWSWVSSWTQEKDPSRENKVQTKEEGGRGTSRR